ncbi:MAG: lysophospholipid acyltransferase family protein [Alcaligenaceae bacterium]
MLNKFGPIFATAVFRLLASLPLTALQILGYGAGWLVWILPSRYKRRAAENLAIAMPEASPKILRASLISAGQLFLEMPFWHIRQDEIQLGKQVQCDGWDKFQEALALGKGLILLGPHAGNFESLGAIYTSRFRATVMFRQPRMQWLQDWIIKTRTRKNLTMAPANQSGLRTLFKALKRGESIGILPDQVPLMGEGVWAPFFGKQAYTTNLVHRLQKLTGAPIFVMAAQRNGIGKGFTVRYQEIKEPLSDNHEVAATQLNRAMEDMIRLMPTQYLWGYNRYRIPREKPSVTKRQIDLH